MKKYLSFLALTSALISPAIASDLGSPVYKAPAVIPCQSIQSCSGWYADFGILGDGTNANIIGGGLSNSIASNGAAVMIGGGYQYWAGSVLAGVQLNGGYEFANATSGAPVIGGKFVGTELIQLGYNFFPSSQSSTTAPSQSPIALTVPANLLATTTPYFNFGGMQRRGISEGVTGAGLQTVFAAGWSSAVDYLYAPSQQGQPATQVVSLKVLKHF
jgi:opacity protein-like surface antigen